MASSIRLSSSLSILIESNIKTPTGEAQLISACERLWNNLSVPVDREASSPTQSGIGNTNESPIKHIQPGKAQILPKVRVDRHSETFTTCFNWTAHSSAEEQDHTGPFSVGDDCLMSSRLLLLFQSLFSYFCQWYVTVRATCSTIQDNACIEKQSQPRSVTRTSGDSWFQMTKNTTQRNRLERHKVSYLEFGKISRQLDLTVLQKTKAKTEMPLKSDKS